MNTIKKISINENGVWAGTGILRDGVIEDCPAILGDNQDMEEAVYEAIEDAIAAGESSVTLGDYTWTWSIEEHTHEVYSYWHGRFYCSCGAMRKADGEWSTVEEAERERQRRHRQAQDLMEAEGTSVDAYGQSNVR